MATVTRCGLRVALEDGGSARPPHHSIVPRPRAPDHGQGWPSSLSEREAKAAVKKRAKAKLSISRGRFRKLLDSGLPPAARTESSQRACCRGGRRGWAWQASREVECQGHVVCPQKRAPPLGTSTPTCAESRAVGPGRTQAPEVQGDMASSGPRPVTVSFMCQLDWPREARELGTRGPGGVGLWRGGLGRQKPFPA